MYNHHLDDLVNMVRTVTRQGKFVSTKVDDRGRSNYTFEIDQAQFAELEQLVTIGKIPDCYRCWYKLEQSACDEAVQAAPDVFANENDGKCYLRFTKVEMTPLPVLEKGKMYTIVYGTRYFKTKDLVGFSCTLNSVI